MTASTLLSYPSWLGADCHRSMSGVADAGGWRSQLRKVARGSQAETTMGASTTRAVGQLDAPHPLALAEDGGDLRAGAHGAARGLERAAHRVGDGAAAADRPADGGDVLHGVGQRAEAGAGRVRGEPPHGRADHDRGRHHRVLVEEVPQDGADAAPAPAQEVVHAAGPSPGHAAQDGAGRGRLVGQLDQELGHRHRGGQVAAVALDLAGIGERQRGEGALGVVERRPGRTAACGAGSAAPARRRGSAGRARPGRAPPSRASSGTRRGRSCRC